jgi:Ca2+-binding RTX toxin-like protein
VEVPRRSRCLGLAAVLTLALLAIGVLPAGADQVTVGDPDDSPSAIDVAQVVQGHYFANVLYRVVAHEKWDSAALDNGRLVFAFNTDSDADIERRAVLEYKGGAGAQFRSRVENGRGHWIGRPVFRRPNSRSVEVWIARWQLKHAMRYRMSLTVTTKAPGNCANGCKDRAPDRGTIFHRLQELCEEEEPTLVGTGGNDTLRGTKRRDVIDARAGNDLVSNVSRSDKVCGGRGDDEIRAGRGFLSLYGGPGSDRIKATGPRPKPCDDTGACAYPQACISGGAGRDVLIGGKYHEQLQGGRGADVLRGWRWEDRLDGGRGQDLLDGGRVEDSCAHGEKIYSCRP